MVEQKNCSNTSNQPNRPAECCCEQKKQYSRPEVAKHGNVESLTQIAIGPSGPIRVD